MRGARPAVLAANAARVFGRDRVVEWCEELLAGAVGADARDRPDIAWLAGTVGWPEYWAQVWGARGLLHIGPPARPHVVVGALADPQWRVREMALKVIARHGLDDPDGDVDALTRDPVRRVRDAAWRALGLPVPPDEVSPA